MNSLRDRLRSRREMARRTRAIERALRSTPSHAVRDELLEIANRYQ